MCSTAFCVKMSRKIKDNDFWKPLSGNEEMYMQPFSTPFFEKHSVQLAP